MTLVGGSWGAQIGVESTDLLLVMTEHNAEQQLTAGFGFKLSAEGSLAVGPLGRDVQAGTNVDFREKTLSYSTTRGIFAGLTLDAAKLSWDKDAENQVASQHAVETSVQNFQGSLNAIIAGL